MKSWSVARSNFLVTLQESTTKSATILISTVMFYEDHANY